MDELEAQEVGFRALNASFDITTPMGRVLLQIQATFAEMERNVIRQRVKESVAAARARGCKGGPPAADDARAAALHPAPDGDKARSVPSICRELSSVPASMLYHYLHADGTLKAPE